MFLNWTYQWQVCMSWDDNLTGVALNIAQTSANTLRVVAGPGTGKTFAMKRRVARLLSQGVDPTRILAVTFTRMAATDLVNELCNLGEEGCEQIRACTLHSFCFSLLSIASVLENFNRFPRPLVTFSKSGVLQFEGAPMLEDIIHSGDFGTKRECTKRIKAFEAAWARLQHETPGWPEDIIDRQFHQAIRDWLIFHRAMLIGELIPEALSYLRNNPTCEEMTQYDHVIVDEYQDLNRAEQEIINLISDRSALAVIGDPDQSIYSFRHAHPQGIIEFSESHENTRDEILDYCRRCPSRIVEIANNLIRNNHLSSSRPILMPLPESPAGQIYIAQWNSLEEEAHGLANYVNFLLENGYEPGDILILSPRRLIGFGIRDALVAIGINTHSFYHDEALETAESQLAFTLLTLLCDINDRVALRYWLGYGHSSWAYRQYATLRDYCQTNNLSIRNALDLICNGQLELNGVDYLITRYRELQNQLTSFNSLNCVELVNTLFPENTDWAPVLREVALNVVTEDTETKKLLEILKETITQPEMPEKGDFVRIMSLHKSKGLTCKVSIIAGCIQGLIPYIDRNLSLDDQRFQKEEQRRLFYVAITRATELLVISSASNMKRRTAHKIGASLQRGGKNFGRTISSQFISELGPSAPQSINGSDLLCSLGIG